MGIRFFGPQTSPIAIDFGASSVKLLQTSLGEKPALVAAAELPKQTSDESCIEAEDFVFLESELPRLLRKGGFKGRRVVFTVPSHQTMVQHLQFTAVEGMKREEAVKSQMQMQLGISPRNTVVRWIDVTDIVRDGQTKTEMICFAIPRDVVMSYVQMLEKLRLQVLDVQTEVQAIVRAFDHIHRRHGDENIATMYIDLGWNNTRVVISHGRSVTFARTIQVGGVHFDRLIAQQLGCDLANAEQHRLAMESPIPARSEQAVTVAAPQAPVNRARSESTTSEDGSGFARLAAAMAKERNAETISQQESREGRTPAVLSTPVEPHHADGGARSSAGSAGAKKVDLTEVLDIITDELSMCLRYHHGLFPGRDIDRVILLGGEARQPWLCRHIVRMLRIPARLGDPLARFVRDDQTMETIGLAENRAQPGWAVVSGLCAASTD